MWIFTPIGFFSIVQKRGDSDLTIRSRVASDLVSLREQFLPSLSPIIATPDADYAFRAKASHRDFAESLASMAASVDYHNFKYEVGRKQGGERAEVYSKVWHIMQDDLQENHLVTDTPRSDPARFTMITDADSMAWKKHVKLLRVARMVFVAAAITNPCKCDDCSHCREIAELGVEIEQVSIHASARFAWIDGRARSRRRMKSH
jgi:hypothetical protein